MFGHESCPPVLLKYSDYVMEMAHLGLTLVHCGPVSSRAYYLLSHNENESTETFTFASEDGGTILPRTYGSDSM